MAGKLATVVVICAAIFLISSPSSHADWITKARFSKRAGIDSIERFLVLRDPDSSRVFGKPIIPLGDINGNGCSDVLLTGWTDTNFVFSTYLYYGGHRPDSSYARMFRRFEPSMGLIGDINGDGYTDLGQTSYANNRNFEIHLGGPLLRDSADYVIPRMESHVTKAVDLDNDGRLELPLSTSINTGFVNIYEINNGRPDTIPKYIIPDTSTNFGDNIATGDFNGDGYPDLAVAAYTNRDSSFVKFYWGGPHFDTIPDFEIWRMAHNFGRILLPLGDFNGDGYEDILIDGGIANGYSIPGGIFFGGPTLSNNINVVTNVYTYGGYLGATSAAAAGDINNDGYQDLIIGVVNYYAVLFEAKVFLGGPGADSIPDIYLENQLITSHQIYFGDAVAGVGDFNGDGIDDFAVCSRTTGGCCWWGEVNFFAGWNSKPSDVNYEFIRNYPSKFELNQNFPNPFNPTTTIEFALPRHSHARLFVYDLLGRRVATLLDRELPAGTHRITWDGKSDIGQSLASGIYFYQLTYDRGKQTKKMLLLK